MGLRDTESCIAWCGRIGLTNRWSLWEWALGLPGNHFFRAGLLWVQEAGFALLCSPMAQSGSSRRRSWAHCGLCWWSGTLLGLLTWSGAESGMGHLEAHSDRAVSEP